MWPLKKKKIIDLTKSGKYKGMPSQIPETYREISAGSSELAQSSDDSALGFLGNMAVSSSQADESNMHTKHLGVKIEDIEYKLDSLSKKLSSIMDRLDLAEKKLERQERKGNS